MAQALNFPRSRRSLKSKALIVIRINRALTTCQTMCWVIEHFFSSSTLPTFDRWASRDWPRVSQLVSGRTVVRIQAHLLKQAVCSVPGCPCAPLWCPCISTSGKTAPSLRAGGRTQHLKNSEVQVLMEEGFRVALASFQNKYAKHNIF